MRRVAGKVLLLHPRKPTVLVAALALLSASCNMRTQRTITIGESIQARAVIRIHTTFLSLFDMEGFIRERGASVTIWVTGEGKNMAYRNRPGTTFAFGRDFHVDIDYCSGGYLWVNENESRLGVALFDPRPPTGFAGSAYFNGYYRITRKQADLLLRKR